MLGWVERNAGVGALRIGQAGWRGAASVAASGSTHLKDAVDLSIQWHLSAAERKRLLRTMQDAGFAAWIRPAVSGLWPLHLHAVPVPPNDRAAVVARYLSPGAAGQVVSYLAGRDGLSGDRVDGNKYRPGVKWSYALRRPVSL